MDSYNVAINTAINFIEVTLEEMKRMGHENLTPIIEQIKEYHSTFFNTYSPECLYNLIAYLSDFTKCQDNMSELFSKICFVFKVICDWVENKKNNLYELMLLKLFEYYHSFLSINVKTYLKFDQLQEIIRFLREDAVKCKDLNKEFSRRLYDDSIVKLLGTILSPPNEHITSLIKWVDNIIVGNRTGEKSISRCSSESSVFVEIVVVEKEIVESKDDRIRRIITKYSRNKKDMDKSPPINENAQTKIMNVRNLI